jgi:hypothetical protein
LRRGQTLQATINNFGTYFDSSSHYWNQDFLFQTKTKCIFISIE